MYELTQEDYEKYDGKKAIAVYPITNTIGVEILDIIYGIDDFVVWRYGKDLGTSRIISGTIFYIDKMRIFLDECVRV